MMKLKMQVMIAPMTMTQPTASGMAPALMSSRASTATPTLTMDAPWR